MALAMQHPSTAGYLFPFILSCSYNKCAQESSEGASGSVITWAHAKPSSAADAVRLEQQLLLADRHVSGC